MTDLSPANLPAIQRQDGWTPDRRRTFLLAIAEGHTVTDACKLVGLSPSSAYQLRNRAEGRDFALGWDAASLLARDTLSDTLLARAVHGQTDSVTRPDGSTIERHRFDNRLGMSMLRRLDRLAESEAPATHAAQLIAQDFEAYLDLIGGDRGPARAGLFLALRGEGGPRDDPAGLGQAAALARAERYLRGGAGVAAEIDTADLAIDQRHLWTGEQWQRAEAAGLIAFAAPDAAVPACEVREAAGHADLYPPVWWDGDYKEWRTHFPPPEGFDGAEQGEFDDDDYERELSDEEREAVEASKEDGVTERWAIEARDRDAWFAALVAAPGAKGEEDERGPPDPGFAPGEPPR